MKLRIQWMTRTAILGVLSFIFMLMNTSITGIFFFIPPWLQIDISDLPSLMAGFAMGPLSGSVVVCIKVVLDFIVKGPSFGGAGQLANLLCSLAFILPAAFWYKYNKNKKGAMVGMVWGVLLTLIVSVVSNATFLLPAAGLDINAYYTFTLWGISGLDAYLLFAVVPFNLLKTILTSVLCLIVYKHISPLLHQFHKPQN